MNRDKLVNTYLGQYLITDVIGFGTTSTVYKAYQQSLNRYVAVKVLRHYTDPHSETRFRREAQAVAQLQHPNILAIYDFVEQEPYQYFVTQYIEGSTTLDSMLTGVPIEPTIALPLIVHVLAALDYAHSHHLIHRDIKPANILLSRPDWPLLADFGIAKLLTERQQLTPAGHVVGTAFYMSPEQASGLTVDARSDLYSVGVVLYEMLTGRVPFHANTPLAVLVQHIREPLPPPRSFNPALDPGLEAILVRALEKTPDDRYQTAGEMSVALTSMLAQLRRVGHGERAQAVGGATAEPPSTPYATRRLPREPALVQTLQASPMQPPPVPPTLPKIMSPQAMPAPPAALPTPPTAPAPARSAALGYGVVLSLLLITGLAGILLFAPWRDSRADGSVATGQGFATASPAAALLATTQANAPQQPVPTPLPARNVPTAPPVSASPVGTFYTVQPGDTLSEIANRFGTTIDALLTANALSDPNAIQVGQRIIIPGQVQPTAEVTQPTVASTVLPTMQRQPSATAAPRPTNPVVSSATVPPPASNGETILRLEAKDWQGGFRNGGESIYAGRSATWIYGTATQYSTMTTTVTLAEQPTGAASLRVTGMDSEGSDKTPIRVTVNGVEIYRGANPLPDDDQPLESGTWATAAFPFDADLLRPGRNEINISNTATGAFSRPPFFMLDYAEVVF